MDAPRVLHVDSGKSWRGGQRQVLLLATGMKDRGFDPLLAAPPNSPLAVRARAAGLAVLELPLRGELDLRSALRLRRFIARERVDIVHAHDAHSHGIALVALLGRTTPLVVTRRVIFRPRRVRLKYAGRVARFIAISNAVRDRLVQAGIAGERITVIHSGVPAPESVTPRNWRRECGWPVDTVLCGVVGAMTREKGLDLLAAIARRLPNDLFRKTRLVLIGGDKAPRGTIGSIETCHAGFVEDIHSAIAGLDMLWHPSRSEGLGTSVIDAMALGVPPVAFATGGLSEVIEDGRSGVLVSEGDVQRFASAVTSLIRDPALRARLASGGRSRAAYFLDGPMIEKTLEVYRHIRRGGA